MRTTRALLLLLAFAACAPMPPPTAPVPEVEAPPTIHRRFLKTVSGGWRIRLTDDHRFATACQYGLNVAPVRSFDRTLYLTVLFENPLSPTRPLVTETKLEPGVRELAIRSPEVRGLRKGGRYWIRIYIYDHPDRKREIGFHDQIMPARLSIAADGSVRF